MSQDILQLLLERLDRIEDKLDNKIDKQDIRIDNLETQIDKAQGWVKATASIATLVLGLGLEWFRRLWFGV